MKILMTTLKFILLGAGFLFANLICAAGSIRVYNWSDVLDPNILADFERASGIKVEYRTYASDAEVNALFDNNTVADVVFPSHYAVKYLIEQQKIQKIDRSQLKNDDKISPVFWLKMQQIDSTNSFAIPYLWFITGLTVNRPLAEEALSTELPVSWELLFNSEYSQKLQQCGISLLNDPINVYTFMLDYQGLNIGTTSAAKIKDTKKNLENFVS